MVQQPAASSGAIEPSPTASPDAGAADEDEEWPDLDDTAAAAAAPEAEAADSWATPHGTGDSDLDAAVKDLEDFDIGDDGDW